MSNKKPEIYLERKFDTYLAEWKSRDDRLPLIITGARQVGKTECVRHFAEGRYKSVVEINFVERPEFKVIVRDGYSVASVIRNISSVEPAFRFVDNETLVFFDDARYTMGDDSSAAAFGAHLEDRVAKSNRKTLLVLADRRVATGELMKIAAMARRSGVGSVLFAEKRAGKADE